MSSIVRAVLERSTALFATGAALELEAECLARNAERQAELLRLADRYAAEGLAEVAARLRRQAEEVRPERPLAGVLPALSHLGGAAAVPAAPTPASPTTEASCPPHRYPPPAAPVSAAPSGPARLSPAAEPPAPARLPAVRNGRRRGR
jgi:hypothetical protein